MRNKTRLIEEENTIYELDLDCIAKQKKRTKKENREINSNRKSTIKKEKAGEA